LFNGGLMISLDIFKHLLPNALAWNMTINKRLREFFEGLVPFANDIKVYIDLVWLDIFPDTTREITAWEKQLGLSTAIIDEQERRDRLTAAWKALGDQDPKYIQDTLQNNGFDVYIHEWWEPGTEPLPGIKQAATPRNPLQWIKQDETAGGTFVSCGEVLSLCGEPTALAGDGSEPLGYILVNKIINMIPDVIVLCGEPEVLCGEPEALCGDFIEFIEVKKEYVVSNDPAEWPYFLYFGGETFGNIATLPANRRDEFETLCLKICPTQQWLGMLIQYS